MSGITYPRNKTIVVYEYVFKTVYIDILADSRNHNNSNENMAIEPKVI